MNDLCNWQPYGDVCYWWPRHVFTTPPPSRDTDCENRRPHGSAPLSHPIIKPSPDSIDFNRVGNHYSSNCQIKAKVKAITCVLTVYNIKKYLYHTQPALTVRCHCFDPSKPNLELAMTIKEKRFNHKLQLVLNSCQKMCFW